MFCYRLCCPDHFHLFWFDITDGSDQRNVMIFCRQQLNSVLQLKSLSKHILVVTIARLTCCVSILISPNWAMAKSSQKMPSVLWIMLDDGRADAIGYYGKPWARTPNMDSIAAAGFRFETAVVQSPVCVPFRRSLKTGLYAHQTGVMAMDKPTNNTICTTTENAGKWWTS